MAKRKLPERDEDTGKFVPKETAEETTDTSTEVMSVEDAAKEDGFDVPETNKEEPVKEESVKEEVVKDEPKIDPDTMKREIAEQVSKDTVQRIAQALTGQQETTKEQKDRYQEIAEQFFEKHGRNPSWFELIPFIKDDLKADMQKEQEEKAKVIQEQKKTLEEQEKARSEAFNRYIDTQLNDLITSGKLPRPTDPQNEADPGVVARKELFKTMMEVNQKRVGEGKEPIYSLKEIFYEHYKAPTAQPAGWDAPVSPGRMSGVPDTGDEYSYLDIHKPKSFIDIVMRK